MVEKKYHALRVLTWIYRIIAVLVFVGGVALGGFTMIAPTYTYGLTSTGSYGLVSAPPAVAIGIGFAIISIFSALTLYAFGELLHLFIDLEENTRESAMLLHRVTRPKKTSTRHKLPFPTEPMLRDTYPSP